MNCVVTGGERGRRQNECFCNNLDRVHWIQTKFGMDILIDPRNKHAKEFLFFSKSKMAAGGQKFARRYILSELIYILVI